MLIRVTSEKPRQDPFQIRVIRENPWRKKSDSRYLPKSA
jgi:hypothetical protein